MLGLSGQDLTRQVREFNTSTPILYSGAVQESDEQEARDAGAQSYLTKPLEISDPVDEAARLVAEADRFPAAIHLP